MNVKIGTEAALFPEKKYINGIFIAVWMLAVVQGRLVGCPPDILGKEAWITGIEGKEGRGTS